MNLLWCKVDVKRFGFSNHHQDLDACWDNRSKWKVYNEKIQTCTWRPWFKSIKNVGLCFSAFFILSDFDPYLLSYIYIYNWLIRFWLCEKKNRWCNLQIKTIQTDIWGKIPWKNKRLMAPVLFENNLIVLRCLVKRKKDRQNQLS